MLSTYISDISDISYYEVILPAQFLNYYYYFLQSLLDIERMSLRANAVSSLK